MTWRSSAEPPGGGALWENRMSTPTACPEGGWECNPSAWFGLVCARTRPGGPAAGGFIYERAAADRVGCTTRLQHTTHKDIYNMCDIHKLEQTTTTAQKKKLWVQGLCTASNLFSRKPVMKLNRWYCSLGMPLFTSPKTHKKAQKGELLGFLSTYSHSP